MFMVKTNTQIINQILPMDPEHLHLLVNHIPIHGLVISTIALAVGLIVRSNPTILTGLALVFICAVSIPVVMATGEGAYYNFEKDSEVAERIDEEGMKWAKKHYDDAEKGAKATYLLIVLSALALIFYKWFPKGFIPAAWSVVALSILCLLLNAWIASSGGKIRRPDFRPSEIEQTD
jgi:hypothetical protein